MAQGAAQGTPHATALDTGQGEQPPQLPSSHMRGVPGAGSSFSTGAPEAQLSQAGAGVLFQKTGRLFTAGSSVGRVAGNTCTDVELVCITPLAV